MTRAGAVLALPSMVVLLAIGVLGVLVGLIVPVAFTPALETHGLIAAVPFDGLGTAGRTAAWCAIVATATTAAGWGLARRAAPVGRFGWLAWCVPALTPAYALWYAWWNASSPSGAFGQWIMGEDMTDAWRHAALLLALVGAMWPIAGAIVLGGRRGNEATEVAAFDRPRWIDRVRLAWHEDRAGLALAWVVVAGCCMADTTVFDLAQVRTIGFELRSLEAAGASPASVFLAAWWSIACAAAVAFVLTRPCSPEAFAHRARRGAARTAWMAPVASLCLVVLPASVLMAHAWSDHAWSRAWSAYSGGVVRTAVAAGAAGILCAGVAVFHMLWCASGRAPRAERVLRATWIVMGLTPAIVIAVLHVTAWNRPGLDWMHDHWPIVAAAQTTHWGWIGAVAGWLAVATAPADLHAAARVDGGAWSVMLALWPRVRAVAGACFVVATVGSAGEVVLSARVEPPGGDWVASALLSAMHYQRADMVAAFVPMLGVVALVAAIALRWVSRHSACTLGCAMSAVLLAACGSAGEPASTLPEWCAGATIVGRGGSGPGQFNYPRAMAWTPEGELVVVDRSGRVQVIDTRGTVVRSWRMPECDQGFPTGVSVSPEGEVWVADTHEHRVTVFDRRGALIRSFGGFGQESGQFVFPTDIAFGDDGMVYVSEYGGNDRIQVFTRDGACVRAFGHHGVPDDESPEPKFDRPQSLVVLPGGRLLVADACNHRIVEVTTDGAFVRSFGTPGQGAGELLYPYGVAQLADGQVLVTEFGGCRLQAFDVASGASLALFGRGGREPGELNGPWASAISGDTVAVLDSTNQRIYFTPAEPMRARARRMLHPIR